MKLITEQTWETQTEFLTEENGKKTLYISSLNGIQVDLKNRNGRVYPGVTMGKEVARYLTEKVKTGSAWGEFGHPENAQINIDRVSHRFTDITNVDKNYYSIKAKVLNNPNGEMVRSMIEDKEGKIGISTRAVGSVKDMNGTQVVQEDLYLVTAGDIVADPSAQKAFVQGIYEGVEYEWMDGVLLEKVLNTKDQYKITMSNEEKTKKLIEVFDKVTKFMGKGV